MDGLDAANVSNAEIFAIILEMEKIRGVKFIQEDIRNIEQVDQLNDLKNKFNLVILI